MKTKIAIKSIQDISKWIEISNIMARSMCDPQTVLSQFNALSPTDRINIKKRFNKCDDIRRTKIPNTEQEAWLIGIMVDAHIIAYEYNIDPLTAVLCINPICKAEQKIFAK